MKMVARAIDKFIRKEPNLAKAKRALREYGRELQPWAEKMAEKFARQIVLADNRQWREMDGGMIRRVSKEVRSVQIEGVIAQIKQQQVRYIQSIAFEAAERINWLQNESDGPRDPKLLAAIKKSGQVALSRAALIGRTETYNAATLLTRARATALGSPGYIWGTMRDRLVRPSHWFMEGKFVLWSDPPVLDNMTGHAGQFPNCRCKPRTSDSGETVMAMRGDDYPKPFDIVTTNLDGSPKPPIETPDPNVLMAKRHRAKATQDLNALLASMNDARRDGLVIGFQINQDVAGNFYIAGPNGRQTLRLGDHPMFLLSKKSLLAVAVVAVAALRLAAPAGAQVPSTAPPYNVDTGALITNAARTAGTVNSANQTNLDKNGVVCTFLQTAVSGTPSITFSIQGYDAATQSYITLATSSTITTSTSNIYTVWAQPGLIAADVPANGVGKSLRLPRVWRIQQVVGGTGGPATTSRIGCNLFK